MVGPKRLWSKKKRFALIGVAVVAMVGLAWLVGPGTSKDLTLRLKLVKTGIEDGTPVLFRVEGAEPYEVHIKTLRYLLGQKHVSSLPSFTLDLGAREFWSAPATEYYADVGDQGWQLEANVYVVVPEKNNIGKVSRVLKDAWREYFPSPLFVDTAHLNLFQC
jgi:hypothetical protein